MSKQFDLEQEIMACWNIVDDIDLLNKSILDNEHGEMTPDRISNILLGLKELYSIKFSRCFNTFEELLAEQRKQKGINYE